MKKSILRASAAWQVVALLGAGSALTMAAPASAQDYTSGAVIGTVTDDSGHAVPRATVTMRSVSQNQVRTFVTDGSGVFTASGLTPGTYDIAVAAPGFRAYSDSLTITAAQESRVTLGLISTTATSEIVVTGRRLRQTQTQGTTGLNVDVTAVNAVAPLGHNITAITLLAPTVQRGVSNFGDVPSVGGSSVAENAYYINGLNITNPDTYVGSARVPFYFYKTAATPPSSAVRRAAWSMPLPSRARTTRSLHSISIGSRVACRGIARTEAWRRTRRTLAKSAVMISSS
jgi:hypothetical protein